MIQNTLKKKLTEKNLSSLNDGVEQLGYDRSAVEIGIVHIGPGAFHRAHQAIYTDDVLKLGANSWGICAVSINSPDLRDTLADQDNLYTLAILDHEPQQRVIGSIIEVLVAPENPLKVIDRLSQASVKVVTMTVTEKGYCLTPEGGLDFSNETIKHDLKNPQSPKSSIGFLVFSLGKRRQKGRAPFTTISCDNLTENGTRLKRAVLQFAKQVNVDLAHWIDAEAKFPCTMVDSITPATNDEIRNTVTKAIGLEDRWPVQRERFTQWVIEDIPGTELPPWSDVGVTFSKNVRGYEATKLRILNGLHSSLAFIGILAGLKSVEEAINHPDIRAFLDAALVEEIIPTLPLVDGLDCKEYGKQILARFENPAICHLLSQIAWDSSQKIPFRILGTIADNLAINKGAPKLCFALAAWMKFVTIKVKIGSPITDSLAKQLLAIALQCDGSAEDVKRFIQLEQMFPVELRSNSSFIEEVTRSYLAIGDKTGEGVTNALVTAGKSRLVCNTSERR